jgi:hypothetical protein
MMATREQIRDLAARLFDAEACADELMGYIERGAPALLYLLTRKAEGRLPNGRMAAAEFLRSLPEPIFAHLLAVSLEFLRRGARGVDEPAKLAPELGSLAFVLFLEERGLNAYSGTDDEFYMLMDSFTRLVLIEEQERAGVSAWVAYYSSIERAFARLSLSYPVREWATPN